MLLPLTTIIPIDGRESSGALVSTASSRTMFMNWSYPRRTPSTPRLPFSCTVNETINGAFSSAVACSQYFHAPNTTQQNIERIHSAGKKGENQGLANFKLSSAGTTPPHALINPSIKPDAKKSNKARIVNSVQDLYSRDNFLSINLFISGKYLLILKLLQKITTEYFKKTKVKDPKALLFPLPKLQRIPNNW
uniref:Uncharacterized protein n=1 Tax=Rhodosorus marinus TaxID=101924 RepID=A0A7S2ZQG8_9RHOD|mmetsp:Transcript_28192/g.110753  ORF Transcript_28192/g.110753 Transcript_28192/m.110753 type:complete len:192 (+) Transcript_28192:199-774(+)